MSHLSKRNTDERETAANEMNELSVNTSNWFLSVVRQVLQNVERSFNHLVEPLRSFISVALLQVNRYVLRGFGNFRWP